MDLTSGYPFWAVKNGLLRAFPPLEEDVDCEVAIIGGGITGALVADELASHGMDVVVLEQRDVGWGSSAASTAMIQYEIDTHLVDLAKAHGEANAVFAYQSCVDAILELRDLAAGLRDIDFKMQQSLYYASQRRDRKSLREEFDLRKRHGFDVSWINEARLAEDFALESPGAILSEVGARLDPYRMTYRLLARLLRRGGRVFDRTCVQSIEPGARLVTLRTADGMRVRCRHLVVAAGYASQKWLKQSVARDRSSYAFITSPLHADQLGYLARTLVWETARPYLYMRSTGDKRLLVGGEDDDFDVPARRDARVDGKAEILRKRVRKLFPRLDIAPAYAWAGTFAETKDGLPFFGPHPQYGPRVHFAMAYGGNGITYSRIGAKLLRAGIQRRKHALAALFGFGRIKGWRLPFL